MNVFMLLLLLDAGRLYWALLTAAHDRKTKQHKAVDVTVLLLASQ